MNTKINTKITALVKLRPDTPTPPSINTFYVSELGDDENNGTSILTPWQTIAKVNASTFESGATIRFNKGHSWVGTLIPNRANVTYSSYGVGLKPVITGLETLTGWTSEGGNIYSKIITSEDEANMVLVDGVQVAMGRLTSGYSSYESVTASSITDTGLGSVTSWVGAEAVIRKNNYHIDRCKITNHVNDTLTFTSLGSTVLGTAGFGYFIQNDLRCLTETNEWFHDFAGTGKFYIYGDPSAKVVQVATKNYLFDNNGFDSVKVENINFKGSISTAINFRVGSDNCNIIGNSVSFAGKYGIIIFGNNTTVTYNIVDKCNNTGVYVSGINSLISDNNISNIALLVGQSFNLQGYSAAGILIEGTSSNNLVTRNIVINTAYDGICARGDLFTVSYNFIDTVNLILTDGGGIYITDAYEGERIIDHNIILNAIGNIEGTTGNAFIPASGIYLDDSANNVTVTNNTVAHCSRAGIHHHDGDFVEYSNNTLYDNSMAIWFQNTNAEDSIHDVEVFDNIMVAKQATKLTLAFSSNWNDVQTFGTADRNYYFRPIAQTDMIYVNQPANVNQRFTLDQWRTFSGQDANSFEPPYSVLAESDFRFEYNATSSPITISVTTPVFDVFGTEYENEDITLQPYTSIVLMNYNTTGYENELIDYINGLSTPLSTPTLTKINSFMVTLKSGLSITLLSQAFDYMRFYGNETLESALRNMVKRSHDATSVNSPTFAANDGITFNGTSNYIEQNYTPATDKVNWAQNSATYGILFKQIQRGTTKLNGSYSTTANGGINRGDIIGSDSISALKIFVNAASTTPSITSAATSGFLIASRNSSAGFDAYIDSAKTYITAASTALVDQKLVTGARRTADTTVGLFNSSKVAFEFAGKGFSEADITVIRNAVATLIA